MRLAVGLLVTWLVVGAQSAKAGDCVPAGPPPKLDFESLNWAIVIASGQTCLRGLRSGAMIWIRHGLPSKTDGHETGA
jgi:hypothetical protein